MPEQADRFQLHIGNSTTSTEYGVLLMFSRVGMVLREGRVRSIASSIARLAA